MMKQIKQIKQVALMMKGCVCVSEYRVNLAYPFLELSDSCSL